MTEQEYNPTDYERGKMKIYRKIACMDDKLLLMTRDFIRRHEDDPLYMLDYVRNRD